jgi:two-component system, OmpR family, phosphate regulon sensor histidine kinase PhoR
MVGALYRQQLDAILFSVNQYSWDILFTWAGDLDRSIKEKRIDELIRPNRSFSIALKDPRSIRMVILTDTMLTSVNMMIVGDEQKSLFDAQLKAALNIHRYKILRLLEYRKLEYRKIEPIALSDTTQVLLFTTADRRGIPFIAGIVLHEVNFIREVLQQKLREASGDESILAVIDQRTQSIVYATDTISREKFGQVKKLWLFPDYQIGITLRGTSPEELVQSRFRRNVLLIGMLDIILLAGAWIVFRTIKREMELVQLKSDFVSNVSHELRTPLALIRMFAETLDMKRVKTEKKKQEYYRTILLETERLTRLINNILNFSRMEANKKKYEFVTADLNTIIRSVIDVYEYEFSEKSFTTVIALEDTLPLLSMDSEAIAETLHNLIDNAMKYSPAEKYLRIASRRRGTSVVIEVQDKGIGIEKEYHKKVFEKFFRVTSGLIHTTKGSGLGLSIVHQIVHAHGGTIELQSTPGAGSTFIINLPIRQ